jgi:arylsulfatase A
LEGVISADGWWKLHLPHTYATLVEAGRDGLPGTTKTEAIEMSLFDMKDDPYERVNVIERYPQIAVQLQEFADQHKKKFYSDDDSTHRAGNKFQ